MSGWGGVATARDLITLLRMASISNLGIISGIFHLIFLDYGCLRVTETTESETVDKEGTIVYKCY